MDDARRRALIERYKDGHRVVVEAIQQVRGDELDAHPTPGEWSPREIAHHLADSEMTSAIRLRRLLVEDRPALPGYDEAEFARRLYYAERPIEASLDALKAARATSAQIVERLSEADWSREGTHSDSGFYSVETWLEIYADHAHAHAAQIDEVLRLVRGGSPHP